MKITSGKALVFVYMKMVGISREVGSRTKEKERAMNVSQTEMFTWVTIRMAKSVERVFTSGRTEILTTENGKMDKSMVMGFGRM